MLFAVNFVHTVPNCFLENRASALRCELLESSSVLTCLLAKQCLCQNLMHISSPPFTARTNKCNNCRPKHQRIEKTLRSVVARMAKKRRPWKSANPAALCHPTSIIFVYVTDSRHQRRLDHWLPDVISNTGSISQESASCVNSGEILRF